MNNHKKRYLSKKDSALKQAEKFFLRFKSKDFRRVNYWHSEAFRYFKMAMKNEKTINI